jgi:hypothetical protein
MDLQEAMAESRRQIINAREQLQSVDRDNIPDYMRPIFTMYLKMAIQLQDSMPDMEKTYPQFVQDVRGLREELESILTPKKELKNSPFPRGDFQFSKN